jgi:hypothetical protein
VVLLRKRSNACSFCECPSCKVESLGRPDELSPFVLSRSRSARWRAVWIGEDVAEAGDVDPDRIDADPDAPTVEVEPVGLESTPRIRRQRRRKWRA